MVNFYRLKNPQCFKQGFLVEFLYVMGPDLCFQEESNRSIMLSAYQRMLYHYSQNQQLSIKNFTISLSLSIIKFNGLFTKYLNVLTMT